MVKKIEDLQELCIEYINLFQAKKKAKSINKTDVDKFMLIIKLYKNIQLFLKNTTNEDNISDPPIAHGILNKDLSIKILFNSKKVKIKLSKGDDLQIYSENDSQYSVKINHPKHGVIEFEISKYDILISRNDIDTIQKKENTDIVFFTRPTAKNLISIDYFIKSYSNPITSSLKINLSGIADCFHIGLKYISEQLYLEGAYSIKTKGKTFYDKPLDKNSSITGSIDFSQITAIDWKEKYKWNDNNIAQYGQQKIAFRFTSYQEKNLSFILVEQLGIINNNAIAYEESKELKEQLNTTDFITEPFNEYTPIPQEHQNKVLETFHKIPSDHLNLLDDIKIVYDPNHLQKEDTKNTIAYVKLDKEATILAFTSEAFKNSSQIVSGDKGADDKNTLLEYTIFHELAHLIGKKVFKQTSLKLDRFVAESNIIKYQLRDFFNNETIKPYINPSLRSTAIAPSRMKEICNKYILPPNNQIPEDANTIDAVSSFIQENYDEYFSKEKLRKTLANAIDSIEKNGLNARNIATSEGITLPSGQHYTLNNEQWILHQESKETTFTIAMNKDGDRLTAYSNASVEEAFALYLSQPETTKKTSPNIYNYFNTKEYLKHIPCPSLKE